MNVCRVAEADAVHVCARARAEYTALCNNDASGGEMGVTERALLTLCAVQLLCDIERYSNRKYAKR